ncbi:MAG: hypothetical protein ACRDJY_10095 [Thermoleophilaceae bacterium]
MLAPLRRLVAMLLPVLLAGSLLAGCGGDDSDSVTDLLDTAFESEIGSADVTLEVEIELDGVDELQDPIEMSLAGPYQKGPEGKLPNVDWEITVGAQNQSFNAGLTSTGDRAFVSFQGTDYEVGQETVAQLNQQLAASQNREGGQDLSDFGVTARNWVVDAEEEGDEEVAGVDTTHVSGKLDVTKVLEDLNTVVQEAAKLGGPVGQQAPPELTDEQKDQIEEVVDDPGFDAYVGKDDDNLHRLSADIAFDVPEDARDQVGGLEGGRVSFSIEFANIGSAQSIEAPEDARPIDELTQQLQGLLGGALGAPPTGGGGAAEPAPQSEPEKQKAYEDCLSTDPNDESVKAFCEALLQ